MKRYTEEKHNINWQKVLSMEIADENKRADTLEGLEDYFVQVLKRSCDEHGKEIDPKKSAIVFYRLGQIYKEKKRSLDIHDPLHDMICSIRSAALFNAALLRSPGNVSQIEEDLRELCKEVLFEAKAERADADLIEQARIVKKESIKMRAKVNEKLSEAKDKDCLSSDRVDFIRKLQDEISQDYTRIMSDLAQYCESVMGEAPCKFTIVGMGSLARKEITPYSDFEHVIVLEEGVQDEGNYSAILNYFRWFTVIFQIVLINLKETILPSVAIPPLNDQSSKYGDWYFDDVTPRGISFDGMMAHACKFPLGRQKPTKNKPWKTELIQPVSGMLQYLNTEENLKNGYHLGDILTKVCFVFGSNDVFDEFKRGIFDKLEANKETSKNELANQIMGDLKKYGTKSLFNAQTKDSLNIKSLIYRSTTIFISGLGRLHNLKETSSYDIIEKLNEEKLISEYVKSQLMYSVSVACEIRLKWYMECEKQNDEMKTQGKNFVDTLSSLVGRESIAKYLKIAYALQSTISEGLSSSDYSYFYSTPNLISASFCHLLGTKNELLSFSHDINKPVYVFGIENCLRDLEDQLSTEERIETDIAQSDEVRQKEEVAKRFFQVADGWHERCCYEEALVYYEESIDLYGAILESCEIQSREEYVRLNKARSDVLHQYGKCLQNLARNIDSLSCFRDSLEIRESISVEKNIDKNVADALFEIGKCLKFLNDFTNAINHLQRSKRIYSSIMTDDDAKKRIVDILHEIGACFRAKNQFSCALKYFEKSQEMQKKITKSVIHAEVSIDSYNLKEMGYCRLQKNKYSSALHLFERAKNAFEAQSSAEFIAKSRYYGLLLGCIGTCLSKMGKFMDASEYFKRTLEIYERTSTNPDNDDMIATCFTDIGECLMFTNKHRKAIDSFDRVLVIETSTSVDDDSRDSFIAQLYIRIILCLFGLKRFAASLEYLKKAFDIFLKISSDKDADLNIANIYRLFGFVCLKMKEIEYARWSSRKSMGIIKRNQSLDDYNKHLQIAHCYLFKGECFRKAGNYVRAMTCYKKARGCFESDQNIPQLDFIFDVSAVGLCVEIGSCYFAMRKYPKAKFYLSRCLEMGRQLSCDVSKDPGVASTARKLGKCLQQMGDFEEAAKCFQQARAIKEARSIEN